ncbi:MAG TPA: histidine kinase [Salinibacter sp.]|nr:histidine kinase [Salinibacter sp.]
MSSVSDIDASLGPLDVQPPPKPSITGPGIGLAAAGWVLYALLYTFFIVRQPSGPPFVPVFLGQLLNSLTLAVYSLPVWWITVRQMDQWHWGWTLAAHLLIGPLYSWVGLESYLAFIRRIGGPGAAAEMTANYQWILFGTLTIYAIQFALYHLVRNVQRLRQKEQQATELLAMAREQQLAALKAQINPHFLFNTLNSISATLKRDPEQAREMIAKLSRLLRYALDSAQRDQVSLGEEIDFARRYLDLERHRFSDRLDAQVQVDVPEDALDRPVPPMILQPLVENALRHGIAPSEDGGTVRVHVTTRENQINVRVEDTGMGPDTDAPLSDANDGVGLTNTSARLQRTFGPDAALHTAVNDPTGFIVEFSLPKNGTPGA